MDHVMAFDKRDVSIEQAAVMNVNPGTAYRMLQDFAELTSGDWVIQNGANSAVGQAVIQLARERNIKTFNVVRQQSLDKWYTELKALGADEVVSDEALRSAEIRELLGYVKPRLGFNCVGGKSATEMARALGDKGVLVTYGGMSREPVTLPTSVFIFRDVRAVGYWQSRWSATATLSERQQLLDTIADKYREGVLDVPLGLVSREWAHIEQHGISGVMEEAMASHGKQLIVFP
jgi:trans-2-enoyl-CoA reductase